MNLNMNPRMEYLLVREDEELAAFNEAWVADIFSSRAAADNWENRTHAWQERKFQTD